MAGKSLDERAQLFQVRYPRKKISREGIRRLYISRGIKRKVVKQMKLVPNRKQDKRDQQRADIIKQIDRCKRKGRKILYLDEVNFTKLAMEKRAWSNRGHNIEIDQRAVYIGYVSVCASISEEGGVEALAIQRKAFDRW